MSASKAARCCWFFGRCCNRPPPASAVTGASADGSEIVDVPGAARSRSASSLLSPPSPSSSSSLARPTTKAPPRPAADLTRFVSAHVDSYRTALAELRRGRKTSHWMWWIFPQLRALGRSSTAKHYGIADLNEARAYMADPVLGGRYRECCRAVASHPGRGAATIMGSVDAMKLQSSATLMGRVGGGPDVQAVLDTFYGGRPCAQTLRLLGEGCGEE